MAREECVKVRKERREKMTDPREPRVRAAEETILDLHAEIEWLKGENELLRLQNAALKAQDRLVATEREACAQFVQDKFGMGWVAAAIRGRGDG